MHDGTPLAGFREREHTADWELEVWAPDLAGLFTQAALGMYQLSGARLAERPRLARQLECRATDPESLLVTFLEELLYLGEIEGLGFDRFEIQIDQLALVARVYGAPLASRQKEIKAVTFHNLELQRDTQGFRTRIVFDV